MMCNNLQAFSGECGPFQGGVKSIEMEYILQRSIQIFKDRTATQVQVLVGLFRQMFKREPTAVDKDVFTVIYHVDNPDYGIVQYKGITLGTLETGPVGVTFKPSKEFNDKSE
jgi:hypothetical protein